MSSSIACRVAAVGRRARPAGRPAPASRRRLRAAGGRARRGGDRSCAGRRPGSASRAGCRARPPRGHCSGRREQRLLDRVLRGGEVAEAPDDRAEHLRRELAQQVLAGEVERRCRHTSTGGALITWRTSIGMFSGAPPVPGRRRRAGGDLVGALRRSRRRRSSSRRGTPWPRRTGRRSPPARRLSPARTIRACSGDGQPLGADQLAGVARAPCGSAS